VEITDPAVVVDGGGTSTARGVDDDYTEPLEDAYGGDWTTVEDAGKTKFEEDGDQELGTGNRCVTFHVGYSVDIPVGTQITLTIKSGCLGDVPVVVVVILA
jgi:hypothetical protein